MGWTGHDMRNGAKLFLRGNGFEGAFIEFEKRNLNKEGRLELDAELFEAVTIWKYENLLTNFFESLDLRRFLHKIFKQ